MSKRLQDLWATRRYDTQDIARETGQTEAFVYNELSRSKGMTTPHPEAIRRPRIGSKVDRILALKKRHPELTAQVVAERVGCDEVYVRRAWSEYGLTRASA